MSNNTHFVFHHKIFSVDGSHFSAKEGGREPCFNMPMGDAMASVSIAALRKEFKIPDDGEDGRLLGVVEGALKFVRVIRVNDLIPNELLDGSASWSVEDGHRLVARCRLAHQLVVWASDNDGGTIDLADFRRRIESPEVKTKIQEATEKAARALGIAEQAVGTIDERLKVLAHELSYIEGLRGRFNEVLKIRQMVEQAGSTDGGSQRLQDDSGRILVLLPLAYKRIGSEFDLLIKQCENVADLLGNVASYVELIRSVRDEIHAELMNWDDVLEDWRIYAEEAAERTVFQVIEHTYRFLAQNYPIAQDW